VIHHFSTELYNLNIIKFNTYKRRTKLKKYIILLSILVLVLSSSLLAQDKGFGLGIIIGEPTGVSGKLWLSGDNALDMAAAWSFKGSGAMLLQADYV
jgi:hypothetical protein